MLRAESSVTLVWVPDPYKWSLAFPLDPGGNHYAYKQSTASGEITVEGVSASESVFVEGKLGNSFHFWFTNGTMVSGQNLQFTGYVFWDQALDTPFIKDLNDPYAPTLKVDASRTIEFHLNAMVLTTDPPNHAFVPSQTESGHWALLDDPHDVFISAGAGNDTVYGGQGDDVLLGGAGQDLIRLGPGDGTALGAAGDDTIWGGRGDQVLDGGAGDDTLYGGTGGGFVSGGLGNDFIAGGSGSQVLDGGAGNDVIAVGVGNQTVFGGAGGDTIYGGIGEQRLEGGAGADVLVSGYGHQTFVGGAGRDVFVLLYTGGSEDFEQAIGVGDFRPGQDIVQVRTPSNRPITNPLDVLSADPNGDAMLHVNGGTMVLHGVRESAVLAHPTRYLSSVADLPAYYPEW